MAKPESEALVQRTFWIDHVSDKALNEWNEKIPDMNKSQLVRIWLMLGREVFERSPVLPSLTDGSIAALARHLRESDQESKKAPRAKRRS